MNAPAVDGVLHFMFVLEAAHDAQVRAEQSNRKEVFAIQRKSDFCKDATDGADRHSFQMDVLRCILPDMERLAARRCVRISDRQRADDTCCPHISFEQYG